MPTLLDSLFRAGHFAQARRGYADILRTDPGDAHANAQIGRIALLSNAFITAEKYLARAVELAPGDDVLKELLADCYARQYKLARAVPMLRAAGRDAVAAQYAAAGDTPFDLYGPRSTKLVFQQLDPLPTVEASVNGSEPMRFLLDTVAEPLLTMEAAERARLRAVASTRARDGTETHLGVARSFRLGSIEVRNVPVVWRDADVSASGTIGMSVFSRFLTTIDYVRQALVLRRRSQLRAFRAESARHDAEILPLWLAGGRFPCTVGSVNGHGPRLVCLSTGEPGVGVTTSEKFATLCGLKFETPRTGSGGGPCYPIVADQVALGAATGRGIPGVVGPLFDDRLGFDTIATFGHEFLKRFAVTFDFTGMGLYVTGPPGAQSR
ncbi:aspartyl protease family protein [Nonomuraea sp. KM88]|uniref:aspartyl protease family protein n=1 Tax=Nonomuraea sp. KM88 TaxID=3457427 RepID=UPI003FCE8EA0